MQAAIRPSRCSSPSDQVARPFGIRLSKALARSKAVAAACDEKRRKEFERGFVVYHDQFRNDLGVAMPGEYLCFSRHPR